jgi:hypothetical protein
MKLNIAQIREKAERCKHGTRVRSFENCFSCDPIFGAAIPELNDETIELLRQRDVLMWAMRRIEILIESKNSQLIRIQEGYSTARQAIKDCEGDG